MDLNNTGKFMSLILRHKPETIGIELDGHGWADVEELIGGIAKPANLTEGCWKRSSGGESGGL